VLGYSPEEMAGAGFYDFVHPDDVAPTKDCMRRLAEGEEIVNCVNRYRHANGSYRYIEWQAKASGELIYAAAKDITDRKRLDDIRDEAVDDFRTIFDGTQIAMFLVAIEEDGTFRYVRTNRVHQQVTGMALEDVKGRTPVEVLGQRAGLEVTDHYRKCIELGHPISYRVQLGNESDETVSHTTVSPVVREAEAWQIVGWSVVYKGGPSSAPEARDWLPLGC
jgi:PAS domain-containing protein